MAARCFHLFRSLAGQRSAAHARRRSPFYLRSAAASSGPIQVFPGQSASGTFGFTLTDIAGPGFLVRSGGYGFASFGGLPTGGAGTSSTNQDSGAICIGASIDSQRDCAGSTLPFATAYGILSNSESGIGYEFQVPEGINTVSFLFSFEVSLPTDSAISDIGQPGLGGDLVVQAVPEPNTVSLFIAAAIAAASVCVVKQRGA